jgi:rod shape-determining protein MreC
VKEPLLERHHFKTFLVLAVLGLALATVGVNSPYRVTRLQRVGLTLTSPLARAGSGLAQLAGDAWRGVTSLGGLHEALGASRTEVRDLRVRLEALAEVEAENRRLRELLELRDSLEQLSVPARIVHQQTAPDRVLVLDRGSAHGLSEDLPVVAPGGVVGKVLAVTRNSAKVQCFTDPEAGAAVLVGSERRQAQAVVRDAEGGRLRLRHLELMAEVVPGDEVRTSGLDQVYPKGWLLGTVDQVNDVEGFDPDVWVRPAVDLATLEEVLVLVPSRPGAEPESRQARREEAR